MTTRSVYFSVLPYATGAGLSIIINAILTIALITSIATGVGAVALAVGVALLLELGKWCAIVDRSRLIAAVLVALSIGANWGALQTGVNGIRQDQQAAGLQLSAINGQLAALRAEMDQNNQAINAYIAMDRIKSGAAPIQERNRQLQSDVNRLVAQRDRLPASQPAELVALIDAMATMIGASVARVESVALFLFAALFDALGAYFLVRCQALRKKYVSDKTNHNTDSVAHATDAQPDNRQAQLSQDCNTTEPTVVADSAAEPAVNIIQLNEGDNQYGQLKNAIVAGVLPPSQRAVLAHPDYPVGSDRVRRWFRRLERDGVIIKHRSNAYRLSGCQNAA